MPRLPDATALGSVSARTSSPLLQVGANPIGQAIAGFGAQLGDLASVQTQKVQQESDKTARFDTQRRFLEFAAGQEERLSELSQQANPGAFGFRELYTKGYQDEAKKFFATVPDDLKGEYDSKLFSIEDQLSGKAQTFERDARKGYYTDKVNDGLTVIENNLYANPDKFDDNLWEGNNFIDNIPDEDVSPIEKEALRRAWREKAQLASLNGMAPQARQAALGEAADVDVRTLGSGVEGAKALLRKKEGFREKPYWDVNALRTGYGSDTVTRADGSVQRVTRDTVVTREDAERDLDRRVREFEKTVVGQVGAREWGAMPAAAQAALLSVAYNYGSLPANVANAVKSGNIQDIAAAVESRSTDNGGINAGRRKNEAAMIRGEGGVGQTGGGQIDPRFADMDYQTRERVIAGADKEINEQRIATDAQAKADYTLHRDNMVLAIETGQVVSNAAILDDPVLDNGDKTTLLKALRARQGEDAEVDAFLSVLTGGTNMAVGAEPEGGATVPATSPVAVNPYNSKQAGIADKAYGKFMSSMPEAMRGPATSAFIGDTGYIPKPIQSELRAGSASTDPEVLASTMAQADVLERAAPLSFNAFEGSKQVTDNLALYRDMVNNRGMSSEEAASRIVSLNSPERTVAKSVLQEDARKFVKDLKVSDVTAAFDPGWFSAAPGEGLMPSQRNALTAEYREYAEERFYQTGGDAEAAKALALEDVKRVWGVSDISGSTQMMRLPPEKFYPTVDGGHTYLRDDALKTAQAYVAENFPDRSAKNVAIMADPLTRADIDAGRPPRYRLFYEYEENGQTLFDEVFAGPWGVTQDVIEGRMDMERERQRVLFNEDRRSAEKESTEQSLRFPEGIDGPERFSNDQLYRGVARDNSPLGRAIARRQQERAAREAAQPQTEFAPAPTPWDTQRSIHDMYNSIVGDQ